MKLKWDKVDETYIEAYLGKWQVITVIKEHDVWKWYNELPFITAKYTGRKFGKAKTAKRAALDAQESVEQWMHGANIEAESPATS